MDRGETGTRISTLVTVNHCKGDVFAASLTQRGDALLLL